MRICKCYGEKLLQKELKGCFNFFDREINLDKQTNGYGLIRDKSNYHKDVASIASVGYGFASLIIGVEHKWLSYDEAYDKANKTLDTFIYNLEKIQGFFYHFVNIRTAKREWNCELSIIDTAIFICGALTAGEYFGGEIKKKAEILYNTILWSLKSRRFLTFLLLFCCSRCRFSLIFSHFTAFSLYYDFTLFLIIF